MLSTISFPNVSSRLVFGGKFRVKLDGFPSLSLSLPFAQLFNWMKGYLVKPDPNSPDVWHPMFHKEDIVDVRMYINANSSGSSVADEAPVWEILDTPMFPNETLRQRVNVDLPESVHSHNGTLYLHTLVCAAGMFRDYPKPPGDAHLFFTSFPITVYKEKQRIQELISLLKANATEVERIKAQNLEIAKADKEIISYWRPNMTVEVIDKFVPMTHENVHPFLRTWMLPMHHDKVVDRLYFYPFVWHNSFWLLDADLVEINSTTTTLPLDLEYGATPHWKWQLFASMDNSLESQVTMGLSRAGESDDLKRILLEANPYYLGLTSVVSLFHSVFDALAFKNDIGFWKNNKSMEGLSARTVVVNCFCQGVIALYLLDNETSFVVLASAFIGTFIEFWKLTKVFKIRIRKREERRRSKDKWWQWWKRVSFEDRDSYLQSETKKYDDEAMRYLSYVLYPLVGGYSVYSLVYQTHKSWYSWVLNSLVGAVYTFGFILMCPQLYLNYKLKSVAHLPWRQMTYKFLNTIIDDLFAFVIKMPLLHRLAVFRDDLVFVVFLYQRWIYRVDKSRVNEFGFSEGPENELPPGRDKKNEAQDEDDKKDRHAKKED